MTSRNSFSNCVLKERMTFNFNCYESGKDCSRLVRSSEEWFSVNCELWIPRLVCKILIMNSILSGRVFHTRFVDMIISCFETCRQDDWRVRTSASNRTVSATVPCPNESDSISLRSVRKDRRVKNEVMENGNDTGLLLLTLDMLRFHVDINLLRDTQTAFP